MKQSLDALRMKQWSAQAGELLANSNHVEALALR